MLHLQDSGIYSCNTRSGLIKGKSLVKKERKERGKGNTRLFHTAKPAWLSLYIETSFIAAAPLSVVPYFRRVCPLSYLLMTARSVPFSVFLKTFKCLPPSLHWMQDSVIPSCTLWLWFGVLPASVLLLSLLWALLLCPPPLSTLSLSHFEFCLYTLVPVASVTSNCLPNPAVMFVCLCFLSLTDLVSALSFEQS